MEGDLFDLEVTEGHIPREINGLLAQAVPDQQFPPEVAHLWPMDASANGDGMVRAFRFEGGHVDFRSRYVRTERFLAERAARRSLFPHYRNPFFDDPSVAGKDRTTANTALYLHAGMLFASKEDGPPYALDPVTLETRGAWRAGGGAIESRTFTAHPKFDSRSGEMFGFGYAARGECTPDIAYYVIDKQGKVTHSAWFQAPVAAMIHDCALTEHYMIFPIMPFTSDLERLKRGGIHFQYEPQMEQILGVMPRYGGAAEVRWFRGPPGFVGHTVNAFERDGQICFDYVHAHGNAFGPVFPAQDGEFTPPGGVRTSFARWIIDYHARETTLQPGRQHVILMDARFGEGPHIDERYALREHRYIWMPGLDPSRLATDERGRPMPVLFNTLQRYDLQTCEIDEWFAGPTCTFQDPVFLPRAADAREGEGYLMAIVNDVPKRRSEVVVLNALALADGPIARIRIPVSLRMGIHASWFDAAGFTK
ncbi:MAG: 9-cis-epoxycarotenoid dioxygenase [Gammaproteobacteria bacterium]|nr:9-cis-epoxycarotenoid dioxygenase [Gammaproteobacteria bacterium]